MYWADTAAYMANISPPALVFKPISLLAKANIGFYGNLTNIAAVFANVGLASPCTTSAHTKKNKKLQKATVLSRLRSYNASYSAAPPFLDRRDVIVQGPTRMMVY